MTRVDLEWTIEGRQGLRSGTLYELHEQELANAKEAVRGQARPGDTVTLHVI